MHIIIIYYYFYYHLLYILCARHLVGHVRREARARLEPAAHQHRHLRKRYIYIIYYYILYYYYYYILYILSNRPPISTGTCARARACMCVCARALARACARGNCLHSVPFAREQFPMVSVDIASQRRTQKEGQIQEWREDKRKIERRVGARENEG